VTTLAWQYNSRSMPNDPGALSGPRILVVDDDAKIQAVLRRGLKLEGYRVEEASDGHEALAALRSNDVDLVVLDVLMPGLSGLDVCRRIREVLDVPILMLTARDTVTDKVNGLESGADDYLVKPFALEELLARVRALMRRRTPGGAPSDELSYADLVLSPSTRETRRSGKRLELTAKEFDLLEFFLRHPRHVLTREQIFRTVWGSDFLGGSNVIDVYVRALREKLEADGQPRLLHTLRGVGYSLRHEP
jgi:two-component system, OmpR family, response regulator MprA